jgi:hypothetical protein
MNTTRFAFHARRVLGRAARFALLGALALAVAGCGGSGSSGGSSGVRVFNAIVEGAPVTVSVGSNTIATGLAFQGLTGYQEAGSGTQEFKVTVPGGTSPIIDTVLALNTDAKYSYVLFGTASAPSALLVQDIGNSTPSGQFSVRVTNAAFGTPALDVYVTAPGASLDTASPNLSNVVISTTSSYAILASGSYQVRYTLRNSKQVIYDAGTLTFASGSDYYMVAYTTGSGTLVNGAVLQLDTTGSGALANSTISQFKMVHAAPGTAAINAFVNGAVAFANVPYQGITSYATLAAGTQTLTAETVTSPGAVIASAQPAFAASTDTSVAVTGLPGAQTMVVLSDNNLPGTTGSARVRFVNVAPNLGAVDVLVNFAKKVSSLGTNAASSYVELVEDTYSINFDLAGTTTVVLSMPSVSVTAGRTYSLYLVGTTAQLAGLLTRDD